MIHRAERRVMGTTASIIVHGGSQSAESLFERLEELEASWSRFRPDSELCRLNASAGAVTQVSGSLYVLVEHLASARRLTSGRFDPTLHDRIVDLGYDRTYRELSDDRDTSDRGSNDQIFDGAPATADIVLFPKASAVLLSTGVHLDPGGLGKGLAGDIIVREAMESGADGVLVEIGGDIVTRGSAPDGNPWRIDIPATDCEPERVIEMNDGAVATSDTRARRWTVGGISRHHVLDPATGLPVQRDVVATVIAGMGWWAEALATAAIISTARCDDWLTADRAERLGAVVSVSEIQLSTESSLRGDVESNVEHAHA